MKIMKAFSYKSSTAGPILLAVFFFILLIGSPTVANAQTGTIQGYKVLMPGNQSGTAPPANEIISVVGGSSSTANPYFLTVAAGNTYTVTATIPSGYTVAYTLCIDSITCHASTPTLGNTATVKIPSGTGHYADLWWHYTPIQLDTAPPVVSITSPKSGATVSGIASVLVSASDNVGVSTILISIDSQVIATCGATCENITWNTAAVQNGNHTLTAAATDAAGNTASASAIVTVANTGTVTVSVKSPNGGEEIFIGTPTGGLIPVGRPTFPVTWELRSSTALTAEPTARIEWVRNGQTGFIADAASMTGGLLDTSQLTPQYVWTGSFNWIIPDTMQAGDDYKIKITAWGVFDMSDGFFSLTNRYVTGVTAVPSFLTLPLGQTSTELVGTVQYSDGTTGHNINAYSSVPWEFNFRVDYPSGVIDFNTGRVALFAIVHSDEFLFDYFGQQRPREMTIASAESPAKYALSSVTVSGEGTRDAADRSGILVTGLIGQIPPFNSHADSWYYGCPSTADQEHRTIVLGKNFSFSTDVQVTMNGIPAGIVWGGALSDFPGANSFIVIKIPSGLPFETVVPIRIIDGDRVSNPAYFITLNSAKCGGGGPPPLLSATSTDLTKGFTPQMLQAVQNALTPNGPFTGRYYTSSNNNKFNRKVFTRTDQAINFDWSSGSPDSRLPSDNFAIYWDGTINFPTAGVYNFTATTDDGMRVWVDGVKVLDKWFNQPATTYNFFRSLSAGSHRIEVTYYEKTNTAVAKLSWVSANVLGVSTPFIFTHNLAKGYNNPMTDIYALQAILQKEGLFSERPTGFFGNLTETAVKKLQAKYNIPQAGIVGPLTKDLLNAISARLRCYINMDEPTTKIVEC